MSSRAEEAARWRAEFHARVTALLAALRDGDDASPAHRFRIEGFAECALALGLVQADELAALLDAAYREVTGAGVAEQFPFAASECVTATPPRFELPVHWRRAPVDPGRDGAG